MQPTRMSLLLLCLVAPWAHAETDVQQQHRLLVQADREDQSFVGDTLLQSATACNPAANPNACTVDRLLSTGARHGFGMAAYDDAQRSHRPAPTSAFLHPAWDRAVQFPSSVSRVQETTHEQAGAATSSECPTHQYGCWGPRVVAAGMALGVTLYQNVRAAHVLDDLNAEPGSTP